MITVPSAFASDIIQREGDAGRQWIGSLPELVAELVERWHLLLDGPIHHGTLAIIIEAHRGALPGVLKVTWQNDATVLEATALQLWNGCGAVQLLEAEPALGALLLERLDARRTLGTLAIGEAVPIAGRLLRRLAIPAPADIPTLHARVASLPDWLRQQWEHVGRPMPRTIVERACDLVPACRLAARAECPAIARRRRCAPGCYRSPLAARCPIPSITSCTIAFAIAPGASTRGSWLH